MLPDDDSLHRALIARDARFDGLFFVGVTTTGIYCRPICPARTPARSRCRFFRRAAEAEQAGFRACFRCRPELAPGAAPLDAPSALARRAARCLEAELPEDGLAGVARRLGVSDRHLRRVVARELGALPKDLVLAHRLGLAKQLLRDTTLPITEVAFASGFSSVRRFNAAFAERMGRTPSALRARSEAPSDTLRLRLGFRQPFDWPALLSFLGRRALARVERVDGESLCRAVRLSGRTGHLRVRLAERGSAVVVELPVQLAPVVVDLTARVRRLFDLDARPDAVTERLGADPALAPLVARTPGLRLPGAFDGFEVALRAIVGQQVSVAAASTLAARLVERFGEPVETPFPGVDRLPPSAVALARVPDEDVAALGMPLSRARTLTGLARAVASGDVDLGPGADPEATKAALLALPGIGPWTAEYIALRALGDPDAFPEGDLALRKALGDGSPKEALRRAEALRPFRGYAAILLWSQLSGG